MCGAAGGSSDTSHAPLPLLARGGEAVHQQQCGKRPLRRRVVNRRFNHRFNHRFTQRFNRRNPFRFRFLVLVLFRVPTASSAIRGEHSRIFRLLRLQY